MIEIPVMLLWLLGTLVFGAGIAVGVLIARESRIPWKDDTLDILAANARRMSRDVASLQALLNRDIVVLQAALHIAEKKAEEAK